MTEAEEEEEEPIVDNAEAPEPQIPSPTEEPQDNEPDIALPVLPNENASGSPAVPRSREGAQGGAHSPPDRRRNVRMSDALSSTTRLHDGLYTEEEVPPSSSPLVRKVRRSEGAASIRARMSRRQSSRAAEKEDVDELSPDRPTDYNPADDELSDTNPVEEEPEVEVEAAEAEETEEEPIAEDEVPEETEIREEEVPEDAVAEEIDEVETAKTIGRKRPRRSLPSRSPEVELSEVVEEEPEEEEPAPKRRRGRPSRSPATQKQPITKPKVSTRAKARDSEAKTMEKQARKAKKAAKDRRISDGTAIELTVQRWVNAKQFRQGDGKEDPIASEVPFQNQEETVVDVFAQVCLEVVETTLAKLYETMTSTEDKEKKKECRIKIRAVDAYREQLTLQLLQLVSCFHRLQSTEADIGRPLI